jgi:hypothetical protein
MNFTYVGDMDFWGVTAWRYEVAPGSLLSQTNHPPNAKYSMDSDYLMPIDRIMGGMPIVVSLAGLGDAPAYVRDYFAPATFDSISEHDKTYIAIEPHMGVGISAYKKLQVNWRFSMTQFNGGSTGHPSPLFLMYPTNVTKTSVEPMLWPYIVIDESASLTEADAKKIKDNLLFYLDLGLYLTVGLGSGGALVGVCAFMVCFFSARRKVKKDDSSKPIPLQEVSTTEKKEDKKETKAETKETKP